MSTTQERYQKKSSGKPTAIFIDCSHSICSGKNSGVERVVRSILRESQGAGNELTVAMVLAHENRFYRLNNQQIERLNKSAAFQRNIVAHLPVAYRWLATLICWILPFLSIRKCLLPDAGHLGLFKVAHTFYEKRARQSVACAAQQIQFSPGEILLLPDAYWSKMRVWPAVDQARRSGAMVASVVYDLIPITHEAFVGDGMKAKFIDYLRCLVANSDLIVAISDTVRDQLRNYLPQICSPGTYCTDIRSFALGAELVAVHGKPRNELEQLFGDTGSTPYLMVANFEPRKNHAYLLDAFELLWQKNPKLKLCLVGRVGWLCDDILTRLANHPRRNLQLFVYHDVTDSELQYCYKSARGVIFASIVEGFGLPIVESLWHGQKTFASNTPIHREVGKQDCVYFDLEDPTSLAIEIEQWENQLRLGKPRLPSRQPTTWADSYQQLMGCCLDAYRNREAEKQRLAA